MGSAIRPALGQQRRRNRPVEEATAPPSAMRLPGLALASRLARDFESSSSRPPWPDSLESSNSLLTSRSCGRLVVQPPVVIQVADRAASLRSELLPRPLRKIGRNGSKPRPLVCAEVFTEPIENRRELKVLTGRVEPEVPLAGEKILRVRCQLLLESACGIS